MKITGRLIALCHGDDDGRTMHEGYAWQSHGEQGKIKMVQLGVRVCE